MGRCGIGLLLGTVLLLCGGLPAAHAREAEPVPDAVRRLLPPGYDVKTAARVVPPGGAGPFLVVVLAVQDEAKAPRPAPARPLLVFRQDRDGTFTRVGRNDAVVFGRDDGGQCDPFEGDQIAVKDGFFTVENFVACGQHWTDYITFRFDPAQRAFLFHNEIFENVVWNPDRRGEALVLDRRVVTRANPRRPVTLDGYKR